MNKIMGEVICGLRKEKGMTQSQLAEKVCVTAQAVSKWETGESNPDIIMVPELAKVLDVSVGVLFGEKEPKKETASKYSLFFTSTLVAFGFALIALISLSAAFLMNWDKLLYSQIWIALSLAILVISLILGVCLGTFCLKKFTSR